MTQRTSLRRPATPSTRTRCASPRPRSSTTMPEAVRYPKNHGDRDKGLEAEVGIEPTFRALQDPSMRFPHSATPPCPRILAARCIRRSVGGLSRKRYDGAGPTLRVAARRSAGRGAGRKAMVRSEGAAPPRCGSGPSAARSDPRRLPPCGRPPVARCSKILASPRDPLAARQGIELEFDDAG
jgi:hypothetical protein